MACNCRAEHRVPCGMADRPGLARKRSSVGGTYQPGSPPARGRGCSRVEAPSCRVSSTQFRIVRELVQGFVILRWFKPGQQGPQQGIKRRRDVPHVEIKRIQQMAQMQLRIIIEAAATKLLVTMTDRP